MTDKYFQVLLLLETTIDPTEDDNELFEDRKVTVSSIYEKLKLYWKTRNTYNPTSFFYVVRKVVTDLLFLSTSVLGLMGAIFLRSDIRTSKKLIRAYYDNEDIIKKIGAIMLIFFSAFSAIKHLIFAFSGKRYSGARHPITNLLLVADKLKTEFKQDVEGLSLTSVDRIEIHIRYLEKAISEIKIITLKTKKASYRKVYIAEISKINKEIAYFKGLL